MSRSGRSSRPARNLAQSSAASAARTTSRARAIPRAAASPKSAVPAGGEGNRLRLASPLGTEPLVRHGFAGQGSSYRAERLGGFVAVGAAALGHVGSPPAALAA